MQVFCSYTHADEAYKKMLEKHLRPLQREGLISTFWSDTKIHGGLELDAEIRRAMDASDIFLLLLSADYIDSTYCWDVEAEYARQARDSRGATVLPVVVRAVSWKGLWTGRLLAAPKDGKPIAAWSHPDEAYVNVVEEVRHILRGRMAPSIESLQTESQSGESRQRGPVACSIKADTSWKLRPAGISELLSPILLTFEGEMDVHEYVDVRLTVNVNVTSRLVYHPRSEATLSIVDRSVAVTRLAYPIYAVNGGINALSFLQVPLHELRGVAPEKRVLVIEGVRVNANQLVGGDRTGDIVASVVVSGIPSVPETVRVGKLGNKPTFSVRTLKSAEHITRRTRLSGPLDDKGHLGPCFEITHVLRVTGALGAFEPMPSFRTRILARFTLPQSVRALATTHELANNAKTSRARLILTDANGAGSASPPRVVAEASIEGKIYPMATLSTDNMGLAATWELDELDGSDFQEVAFGLSFTSTMSDESVPLRGIGTVSVSFAPLSTVTTQSASAPVPRFASEFHTFELFNFG